FCTIRSSCFAASLRATLRCRMDPVSLLDHLVCSASRRSRLSGHPEERNGSLSGHNRLWSIASDYDIDDLCQRNNARRARSVIPPKYRCPPPSPVDGGALCATPPVSKLCGQSRKQSVTRFTLRPIIQNGSSRCAVFGSAALATAQADIGWRR